MNVLIFSCSLNPNSRSRQLALAAQKALAAMGPQTRLMDLSEHEMPLCAGGANSIEPAFKQAIQNADAILLAAPVYNYDLNAAAKNLVEHTGKAWTGKVVGFLAAAGGSSSYMSVMGLANSLMLDFRCIIVPCFVYAPGECFRDNKLASAEIEQRIEQLCSEITRIAAALTRPA